MKDILSEIIVHKRVEIDAQRRATSIDELYRNARDHKIVSLRAALEASPSGIIAEFKRRSPSKGWIHRDASPADVAPGYERSGAAAMSVLTDEEYFGGTLADVHTVRPLVGLPILRKDFTIDEYQLHQARAAGADAVLLIAAALSVSDCKRLAAIAHEQQLETLLEVHNENELEYIDDNIDVVGVNNRNLGTFVTDTANSVALAPKLPRSLTRISESGLKDAATICALRRLGFRGFLIGEQLMRGERPADELARLVSEIEKLSNPFSLS